MKALNLKKDLIKKWEVCSLLDDDVGAQKPLEGL